jgi:hypothetical protein
MSQIKGKQIKDASLDPKKLKTGLIPAEIKLGSAIVDFTGEADSTLVTKKFVVDQIAAADTKLEGAAGEGLVWDETNNELDIATSGVVTTMIADGNVTNDKLAGEIEDSKLNTIITAGKVANSATTATNANTASAIVARDAAGAFAAGVITAASVTVSAAPVAGSDLTNKTYVDDKVAKSSSASIIAGNGLNEVLNGTTGEKTLHVRYDNASIDIVEDIIKVKDLGIQSGMLAELAVTTGKINNLAVTNAKINDLAISTNKIADLAVSTDKIYGLAVTSGKLATDAVETDKIKNLAVTNAKLADATIAVSKIAVVNQADGLLQIGNNGKIAESFLPDSIVGQLEYQGTINAAGSAALAAASSANKGHYYVASEGFDRTANYTPEYEGDFEYNVGDWLISNGTSWDKVDNTDAVATVHGRIGNIVAVAGDYSADLIDFTPVDELTSTNVQDAIAEVKNLIDDLETTAVTNEVKDIQYVGTIAERNAITNTRNGMEVIVYGVGRFWYDNGAWRTHFLFGQNTNNGIEGAFVAGYYNTVADQSSTAFGYGNTANASRSFAIGTMNSATGYNSIVSGEYNYARAEGSSVLGGRDNQIDTSASHASIVGGRSHSVNATAINSVIIGGNGITATLANTVYMPNAYVTNLTPASANHLTSKQYVDDAVSTAVSDNALNEEVHIEVTGGVATTGVTAYTGAITFTAGAKTDAILYVNGIKIQMTELAFFAPAGAWDTITKNMSPQAADDQLFFDVTALGYAIEADDVIEIVYYV